MRGKTKLVLCTVKEFIGDDLQIRKFNLLPLAFWKIFPHQLACFWISALYSLTPGWFAYVAFVPQHSPDRGFAPMRFPLGQVRLRGGYTIPIQHACNLQQGHPGGVCLEDAHDNLGLFGMDNLTNTLHERAPIVTFPGGILNWYVAIPETIPTWVVALQEAFLAGTFNLVRQGF